MGVLGAGAITARWPIFGPQLVAAGFRSVYACPLRWRGATIGALNSFMSSDSGIPAGLRTTAQAFADVATLTVVQAALPEVPDIAASAHAALQARDVVEMAKGVLAAQHEVEIPRAFELLLARAALDRRPLELVADEIVRSAVRD